MEGSTADVRFVFHSCHARICSLIRCQIARERATLLQGNGDLLYVYGAINGRLGPNNDARFPGRKATTLDPRLLMSRMTEGERGEGESGKRDGGGGVKRAGRIRCGPYN